MERETQSIRLFCQDETKYGLLPITNRRITLQGIKPVAEIDYSYASIYLYGAVEPMSDERFFLSSRIELNAELPDSKKISGYIPFGFTQEQNVIDFQEMCFNWFTRQN